MRHAPVLSPSAGPPPPSPSSLIEHETAIDAAAPAGTRMNWTRRIMRYVLAAFFAAAGFFHLLAPEPFLAITPNWVFFPSQVIFVTGLFEIAAAVGLLTTSLRKACGVALAAYALCVWPANFKHAFEGIDVGTMPLSWWYHGPRLALQPVIIWWALFASEVVDWPFASGASPERDQS